MKIEDLDIEGLVKESIKSELSEIDIEGMVREAAQKAIHESFIKKIDVMVSESVSDFVSKEIQAVLDGKVTVSDGWSSPTTYDSLEVFVKAKFKKELSESYKNQAVISKLVTERVTALMSQEYGKVTEKIADVLTQSTLVKK